MKSVKKAGYGKSCIRFQKLEDVALDLIAQVIRQSSPKSFNVRDQSAPAENEANKASQTAARKAALEKSK